jgi:ADP-ribose pyrophosphatase YjhB (NUDIX family)
MTQTEQRNLYNHTFDTLWKELWMEEQFPNHISISNKYKQNAKYKHTKMIERWFKDDGTCLVPSQWESAEWGFPKGRRNRNETNNEVANREFQEETGIDPIHLRFLKIDLVNENYVANNGHHYNNLYRVAIWNSPETLDLEKVWEQNKHMYSFRAEISAIRAMSLRGVLHSIRHYETWKKKLFETCFSIVR